MPLVYLPEGNMQPYYSELGITIYHGDMRDVLPLLPLVDLVLTDPPYGIEGSSGTINRNRGKGEYIKNFNDTPDYIKTVVVPAIVGLISSTPCVVLTPGNKNLCAYPQPQSFGVFFQPASVGLQVFGNADAQPIFYYGKNASGKNMGVPCSYVLTEHSYITGHPCAKPVQAWTRLLKNISKPGLTVLDPFLGSGTTLEAAKNLGLSAIGIEIEEKYCEIAANRLRQEVLSFEVA